MSNWWKKKEEDVPFTVGEFNRLLEFYLFMCPVEIESGSKKNGNRQHSPVSSRGVTLRQKGWTGSKLNILLSQMKHTHTKQLTYLVCPTGSSIEDEVKMIERNSLLSDKEFEMIVFTKRSDMSITASIFYYIRNALAHGSFSVTNGIYYFESSKKGTVFAQIRLREQTLMKWIYLFNSTVDEISSSNKVQRRKRKSQRIA